MSTRGGASFCIHAVAQQESWSVSAWGCVWLVTLTVRSEQPQQTLSCPSAALGAVLLPSGPQTVTPKQTSTQLQQRICNPLCYDPAISLLYHCYSKSVACLQGSSRGKEGKSPSRMVYKQQSWVHITPSKEIWNWELWSLIPLQIRDAT